MSVTKMELHWSLPECVISVINPNFAINMKTGYPYLTGIRFSY